MPQAPQNPGQIKAQKKVTKTNDHEDLGAMIGGSGFNFAARPANALMVSAAGKVKVRLERGVDDVLPSEDEGAQLIPGCWHGCEAFVHVYDTGTTAGTVTAAVTY
jgi:hypothetical protein